MMLMNDAQPVGQTDAAPLDHDGRGPEQDHSDAPEWDGAAQGEAASQKEAACPGV
jgi:hypothetical protein